MGDLLLIDEALLAWVQGHRQPALTAAALFLSQVHGTLGLLLAAALLGVVAWRQGEARWLFALVAAVPGAMLLNVGLKHLVQRARPVLDDPLMVLHTYSFPSGHAAGSAALYTWLALWVAWHWHPRARWAVPAACAVAALLAVLVSLSRVYLGVHYLSDVLAGMAIGALWALAWVRALQPAGRQAGTLQP